MSAAAAVPSHLPILNAHHISQRTVFCAQPPASSSCTAQPHRHIRTLMKPISTPSQGGAQTLLPPTPLLPPHPDPLPTPLTFPHRVAIDYAFTGFTDSVWEAGTAFTGPLGDAELNVTTSHLDAAVVRVLPASDLEGRVGGPAQDLQVTQREVGDLSHSLTLFLSFCTCVVMCVCVCACTRVAPQLQHRLNLS